ncbi:unnamed protein product [Knipowitschia caucasica]
MALLRIVTLLSLSGLCHSQPLCSYGRLWNFLNLTTSNSYLLNFRPVKNWTDQTEVKVEMIIYGILKVDEMSQTVVAHTWTTTSWKNDFIEWNPKDFCNIGVFSVPSSKVWIPDLDIQEDASDSSSIQQSPFVNLYQDGWASTTARQLLTFTCQLDLNMYPFDRQQCNVTFSPMTSSVAAILLTSDGNGTQITNTSKSVIITEGEWELKNIRIHTDFRRNFDNETYSELIYTVNLTRRPMLYVINFIVPLLYFLILDLASFFINEARGEKLSFKVTILLSISVLLLILKDMLPSTERHMPWIGEAPPTFKHLKLSFSLGTLINLYF